MKWWLGVCAALFCLTGNVQGAQHPQQLIETTATHVIQEIKADKERLSKDDQALYSFVEKNILPHFDFEKMARLVLGKYWRRISVDERKQFVEEFRKLLVRTYATSLFEYANETFVYLPFRGDLSTTDAVVRSEVSQPGGFPVPINYRLHYDGSAWKAYDVTIDDISLVTNYRSGFGSKIRDEGMPALIKMLKDRNQEKK